MVLLLADFETMHKRLVSLRAEVGECVSDMQDRMEAIGSLEQTMCACSASTPTCAAPVSARRAAPCALWRRKCVSCRADRRGGECRECRP